MTARTCFPDLAASINACMMGESPEVLYSVCLIANTFGSCAASSTKRVTVEVKV